jgi:hypothetical protein
MRRVVLTLTLLSLAFAPAPFPRPERRQRETQPQRQLREIRECERRLKELGVAWQAEKRDGMPHLRFHVRHPANGSISLVGWLPIGGGGVPAALREAIGQVEEFVSSKVGWFVVTTPPKLLRRQTEGEAGRHDQQRHGDRQGGAPGERPLLILLDPEDPLLFFPSQPVPLFLAPVTHHDAPFCITCSGHWHHLPRRQPARGIRQIART